MIKKLFSHTAIYGLAPQIPKLAGILILPLITPFLTAVDFGVYGLITAVVGAISVFATLGMNVILSNSFFKDPEGYMLTWRRIYGFLVLWNIPYSFILAFLIYFFIPDEAASNTFLIIIINVVPVAFFGPTAVIGALYFQLKQKPLQIAVRSFIIGSITIILNLYFIAYLKMGYMGWFISLGISQMLLQISYWTPLNRTAGISPIYKQDYAILRKQLKVALPIVPHYYGGYLLNTSDRIVMKMVSVPAGQIGAYNAVNTVGNGFLMIGVAAGQAINPMLMTAYKNNNQLKARNLIFVLQIVFFCMTFIVCIWLKEIFDFLLRIQEFKKLYSLGIIIIMAYNYRPMFFGANFRLFFNEKTHKLMNITLLAGVACFILNYLLIPIWGYQVAAYTTFAGLMYMGYAGYFLKEYKETSTVQFFPLVWLAITILLTAIATYVVEFQTVYKIICTVLFSIFGIWVTLFFARQLKTNDD